MNRDQDRGGGTPSLQELRQALVDARDADRLKSLYDRVAIAQERCRRSLGSLEERNDLAELRLRVGRKLGAVLGGEVQRGGHGSSGDEMPRRGGSSRPLPAGISWSQSSRFQQLARIPEARLRRYLDAASDRGEPISLAGALRAARTTRHEAAFWSRVFRAVRTAMPVDVCIGVPADQLGAKEEMDAREAQRQPVQGNVFVFAPSSPEEWLARLAEEDRAGRVSQAMLSFRARIGAPWFVRIASDNWSCCLLRRPPGMSGDHAIVYRGGERLRFWHAFRSLGTVVEPAGRRAQGPAADR